MPDCVKVIKGLETHLKELSLGKVCIECPYFGDNPCEIQLIAETLELLKAQDMDKYVVTRGILGLWCDDITFCPEKCDLKSCPRNVLNMRDRSIPHSFSVEIPQDCPKKQEGRVK